MIKIDGLTKRYGDKTAVDRLSFVVEPGVVTGFLSPNGAGKGQLTGAPRNVDSYRCGRGPGTRVKSFIGENTGQ